MVSQIYHYHREAYDELQQQLAATREQLATITAERDKLAAEGVILRNACESAAKLLDFGVVYHECRDAINNSPAIAAEAERVKRLERFVEAVLKFDADCDLASLKLIRPLCEAWRNHATLTTPSEGAKP